MVQNGTYRMAIIYHVHPFLIRGETMNETVSAKALSVHTPTYLDVKPMDGIQFVTDARGRKRAVLIDLEKHGDLWEDFHDIMVARSRQNEPRVSLESVLESHQKRASRRKAKTIKKRRT
jgi:hypothetical protein